MHQPQTLVPRREFLAVAGGLAVASPLVSTTSSPGRFPFLDPPFANLHKDRSQTAFFDCDAAVMRRYFRTHQ